MTSDIRIEIDLYNNKLIHEVPSSAWLISVISCDVSNTWSCGSLWSSSWYSEVSSENSVSLKQTDIASDSLANTLSILRDWIQISGIIHNFWSDEKSDCYTLWTISSHCRGEIFATWIEWLFVLEPYSHSYQRAHGPAAPHDLPAQRHGYNCSDSLQNSKHHHCNAQVMLKETVSNKVFI